MKVPVVLVLVVCLAGGSGGFHKLASQSQVKYTTDAYWKYVQQSTSTPEKCVKEIRHSPPGQHLCSIISKSINVIHSFFHLVYNHIVSWINSFFHMLCYEIDHLKHELEYFLHHLEIEIHHHGKVLAEEIRCKLDDLKKHSAHHIKSLDPHGLKISLLHDCKGLEEHVDKCHKHLQTHHHHHHHGHHHHHHGHHHHHHGHHHHHHGHHHHHHGHRHHHGHHHGHRHGHRRHFGHHHHHHDHKHPCDRHHGHDHGACVKKSVDTCIGNFKLTLVTLIHKFEEELDHVANKLNEKLHPKKPPCKLDKDTDHLQDKLENIWKEWTKGMDKKG